MLGAGGGGWLLRPGRGAWRVGWGGDRGTGEGRRRSALLGVPRLGCLPRGNAGHGGVVAAKAPATSCAPAPLPLVARPLPPTATRRPLRAVPCRATGCWLAGWLSLSGRCLSAFVCPAHEHATGACTSCPPPRPPPPPPAWPPTPPPLLPLPLPPPYLLSTAGQVAILCNHQRSVAKTHGTQMEKIQEKLAGMNAELKELEDELAALEGGGGKKDKDEKKAKADV